MCGIRVLSIETGIGRAAHTGGDGGDSTGDASDGVGDRTTSNDMARDVLYMQKNFHSNSSDVEYSPSVDRDGYLQWQAVLTGGDGGDCTRDGGDSEGDRTTSNDRARDVLYMLKNFHFNSGDVQYAHSVDRDWNLARCAHGWGWR
jgi:hypothetical protein